MAGKPDGRCIARRNVVSHVLREAPASMGWRAVRYHGSEEGAKFMEEIEKISIKSVRLLISKLIGQGLDRSKPQRLGDQAALVVMGACVRHMDIIVRMKERVASIAAEMSVLTQSIDRCSA
jgi:hypothetical protein